ncbi:conserved hypothetical protein [Imperialibacter sp. EC-SDR9]|nr:conserved hypothetical protein [Imperialibacter sp. 89]CAD5297454.1 conserved hypothetical protein [Imperialibacter sp. 75]VVT34115.1 conserved hypothetical protein [Imperialibacter sp. EC-SDR9]
MIFALTCISSENILFYKAGGNLEGVAGASFYLLSLFSVNSYSSYNNRNLSLLNMIVILNIPMRQLLKFTFALCLIGFTAQAQEEEINIAGFRFLDYTNDLPADLLSGRSAVFVSVPPKSRGTSERGDWKGFSTEMHQEFRKMGIDAVAYLNIDDVMAGTDVTEAFSDFLNSRQIKNLILLSKVNLKIAGKESERVVVVITPYDGTKTYMSNGQQAWKDQDKDLEKVVKNLGKAVYKSKQENKNFLITEKPEFFTDVDIVTKRRFPSFAGDLKIDKLAVPMYTKVEIPADKPGGIVNNNVEKEIQKYNAKVASSNNVLKGAMQDYPFKYELVEYDGDDKKLYNAGYQYVLLNLNTTGYTIREMLNYEVDKNETDYITMKTSNGKTILRTIPVHAPVYKFYVKHLVTGDVYLGTKWDADETMDEALGNYIQNFKDELKIR